MYGGVLCKKNLKNENKKIWCQWHFEVFNIFLKIEGVILPKCANDKKWLFFGVLSKKNLKKNFDVNGISKFLTFF